MPFFQSSPRPQSDTSFNHEPIQVIASFSCTGEILPLYAKLRGYTVKLFNVTRIIQDMFKEHSSMKFKCKYTTIDDPESNAEEITCKEIYLLYYIERHCWVMEREK